MTTKKPAEYYSPLWEQAAKEEFGVKIKVEPEDQMLFVNALYDCRKATGGFDDLIVMQPQPLGTVFIVHKMRGAVE